ncbi:MAG: hypothetical protein PHP28_11305 [Actinomycetota bacterium]|nr:hypothetical protein [Actinomycetota bacterium]MDD5667396.1 hypothetical protein [Actinomycetota bacterium]
MPVTNLSRLAMTCRGYEGEDPIEPRYFAYDIFGRKISEWDAVSTDPALRPSFSYNLLDYLTRETRPIDGSTSFTKLYGRDEAGRMTSLSVQDAAAPGGAALGGIRRGYNR